MIGLRRGTVQLCDHEKSWEEEAEQTIKILQKIFGSTALNIQHVGSTSIKRIKAKPIIDIMVSVNHLDDALALKDELEKSGFYLRSNVDIRGELLFAAGNYYTGGDVQTHFVHIVEHGSMNEINYVNFRDYLNSNYTVAKQYEDLKISLMQKCKDEPTRQKYCDGKAEFIALVLRKALVKSYLGKTVDVEIDRPLGYIHKKEKYSIVYPINYGYIPGVLGGDGEELDVYIIGEDKPLETFTGKIIGIVYRKNDVEDKLIACGINKSFTKDEIAAAINFQEQYYKTEIETI